MQTRSKPTEIITPETEAQSLSIQANDVAPHAHQRLKRALNLGLALTATIIYVLYLTKGAHIYTILPGGRKFLFSIAGITLIGLAVARLRIGANPGQLLKTPVWLWQQARISEWPPVFIIFLLAFGLRLWGINFGLPNLEQVDEWAVADRALHIVQTGNFDPLDYHNPALPDNDRQAFTYPTLYTYLQTGVSAAHFLQGVVADKYEAVANITNPQVKPDFYLWGRALTALLGALSSVVVYIVARQFYGRRAGLVAALFMSFFYLNAVNSHWITTDVPSGFFALLPFLFIWPILQKRDNWKIYAAAGFLAGLAIATKYNNGLILLPVLLAHFLARPPHRWLTWNLAIVSGALLAGFFVGVPFAFFHLPNFLTDIAAVINHYQNVGHTGHEGDNNWLYYLQAISYENLAILGLALLGIILAFVRHQRRDVVLLVFPLLSYLQLSSYKVNFTRNLMPIIPFLAIFGGLGLVLTVERFFELFHRTRFQQKSKIEKLTKAKNPNLQNFALAGLAALAIVGPAFSIIHFDSYNAKSTTRALALDWVENNLPRGSKLWLEPGSLDLLPANQYQLGGGDSVLAHPLDWYAANNYNYLVLSEATYKDLYLKGDPSYQKLIEGLLPDGLTRLKTFRHDENNQPGPTLLILATKLPTVATSANAFAIQKFLNIDWGQIKLLGLDLPTTTKAGSKLPLALYWQTLTTPTVSYTVFVHLVNSQGQIVAQLDLMPLANTRPTTTWKAGEILRDPYSLIVAATLPPGQYHLHVGFYDAGSGARLKTASNLDEVDLGVVNVQ